MRYYKLMYDYEKDDGYINCDRADIGDMNEYIVSKGVIIDEWKDVVFKYDSTEGTILTDYLANLYRWLIVSDKFVEVTKSVIGNQVQYLPVKIVENTEKVGDISCQVANIVNVLDAFDLENSDYSIFKLRERQVVSVKKYALKSDKIEGNHIFRLKDDMIPVFVSETLKKIIEDNNLSGFAFLEVAVN